MSNLWAFDLKVGQRVHTQTGPFTYSGSIVAVLPEEPHGHYYVLRFWLPRKQRYAYEVVRVWAFVEGPVKLGRAPKHTLAKRPRLAGG